MSFQWDEQLIQAVDDNSILYDNTKPNFKDTTLKQKIWTEIAEEIMGKSDVVSVSKIKNRWKSIRDSYVKNRNRKLQMERGSKAAKPYKYEHKLHFLAPFIRKGNADSFRNKKPKTDLTTSPEVILKTEDPREDRSSGLMSVVSSCMYELLKNFTSPDPTDVSVDLFFHGIAQSIKKLEPAAAERLKQQLSTIVADALIKELDETRPTDESQ